jgi:hypothetical protein
MSRIGAFFVGLLVLSVATGQSLADPPAVDPEMLLKKWEAESAARLATHATFTRIEYRETVGGNRRAVEAERRATGRLYVDSAGHGFYKIDGQLLIVWSKDGACLVDFAKRSYLKVSQADLKNAQTQSDEFDQLPVWQQVLQWYRVFARVPLCFDEADDVLPLCGKIDAATTRLRFDLAFREDAGTIFVTARPKLPRDAECWRQIAVQLSPDMCEVLAHRTVFSDGVSANSASPRSVVHIFQCAAGGITSADLEAQMHPDLDGLRNEAAPVDRAQSGVQSAGANGVRK